MVSAAWFDREARAALDAAADEGSHTCRCGRELQVKTQSKLRVAIKWLKKATTGASGGRVCAHDSCDHPDREIRAPSRYFTCSNSSCREKFRCHVECLVHLRTGAGTGTLSATRPGDAVAARVVGRAIQGPTSSSSGVKAASNGDRPWPCSRPAPSAWRKGCVESDRVHWWRETTQGELEVKITDITQLAL